MLETWPNNGGDNEKAEVGVTFMPVVIIDKKVIDKTVREGCLSLIDFLVARHTTVP